MLSTTINKMGFRASFPPRYRLYLLRNLLIHAGRAATCESCATWPNVIGRSLLHESQRRPSQGGGALIGIRKKTHLLVVSPACSPVSTQWRALSTNAAASWEQHHPHSLHPLDETQSYLPPTATPLLGDEVYQELPTPPSKEYDPPEKNPIPDFDNATEAFRDKSTAELVRNLLSFSLCRIPVLVQNAETLVQLSRSLLGDALTDAVLRATLFGHFCAGDDETRIRPAVQALSRAGIGCILDFAAEDDNDHRNDGKKDDWESDSVRIPPPVTPAESDENTYNRHLEVFQKSIRDVSSLGTNQHGYAAIKVTALAHPRLLERMSIALDQVENLFLEQDEKRTGTVTLDEFQNTLEPFYVGEGGQLKLTDILQSIQNGHDDSLVHYNTWIMSLGAKDLQDVVIRLSARYSTNNKATNLPLTDDEVVMMDQLLERGHVLAREASANGTRLLIDAEQVRVQPVIDALVHELQSTYNDVNRTNHPVIYNTYQCYLKDIPRRLEADVARSRRLGYHLGAKLVRGAYMERERELATRLGYPSPIHDSAQDTHDCYNTMVDKLLQYAVQKDNESSFNQTSSPKMEIMLATHNRESIEKTIQAMNRYGMNDVGRQQDGRALVSFAQLYGMSDHLTWNLGKHGYRAYKYVPYGPVPMAMPYLIRRAKENSSIAGGSLVDSALLRQELGRRILGSLKK